MKNPKSFFSALFILLFVFQIQADPGDTIVVQTFQFDGFPVGEGWLAPREGYFDFSAVEGKQFEKVIMEYTLKCDPTQDPPCGEWDYITYMKVYEHKGYGELPNFVVGGEGGYVVNEFPYVNSVSYRYEPRLEQTAVFDEPGNYDTYQVGTGTQSMTDLFDASKNDARTLLLYKADELEAAGLSEGDITGMMFNVASAGSEMNRMTIRIVDTEDEDLSNVPEIDYFTEVYAKNTDFNGTGWQYLEFSEFFEWDGSSNIIVDISYTGSDGGVPTEVLGTSADWDCAEVSSAVDYCMDFEGPDMIALPVNNFSGLNDEITVSFWLKGGKEQPQNDCVFEARDADGNRIINTHLPWSNGTIYWDAGNESGYDRIEKQADNYEQYKNKWHHWAFTKNSNTGRMSIYLDGELWHWATGKNRTIGAIDTFVIGRGLWDADNFYDGQVDEFRVFSKELDQETIAAWMNKSLDATHPDYADLLAYYKFDDIEHPHTTTDEVTNQEAVFKGIPQRVGFRNARMKGFVSTTIRPNVKFVRNSSDYTIVNHYVTDSFPNSQVMIDKYVQLAEDEKPVLDETVYVYPGYYHNYVYDENGQAIDSTWVTPDGTLNLEMLRYSTTEPGEEIIEPWEIGRFITPYGNGLSLGSDGWTWLYDVTDFQQLFHGDSVHMKAGNFQELMDMKLLFIEGTPPRDVKKIEKVYSVNPQLKNFDNVVVEKTIPLMPDAKMFKLKTTVSGHGFGEGANCGEFCPNTHTVEVNGNEEFSWEIIQECGTNPLFPQGGTWFYDRAGWCPGKPVTEKNLELTPFINVGVDTSVTIDYDIDYDPYGNYVTEIHFVSYGEPNFTNDASVEKILAPSDFKLNSRFNPTCGSPIIVIKNTGADDLTALTIEYGINGHQVNTYEWTGNLKFLETEKVVLPAMDLADFDGSSQEFTVIVRQPNNAPDQYIFNNEKSSSFELAPVFDHQLVIKFKTNSRPQENSYKIFDAEGNVVFIKANFAANTLYVDTLDLAPGCYEFVAYDSAGDGMYNWPSGAGNGYITLWSNGSYVTSLERWFGEYIRYGFVNTAMPVGIEAIQNSTFSISPNPSTGDFVITFLRNISEYQVDVFDVTGRKVYHLDREKNLSGVQQLNLSGLETGVYLVNVKTKDADMFQKVVIER